MIRNSPCFLQRHLYHFFSFISNVGRSSGCGIHKYKDPFYSEFTAKQCIYLRVVFAFTYSVSAVITVGNRDLQLLVFRRVLYRSTACCPL